MKSIFIAATLLGVIHLTVGARLRARRNLYDFKRIIEHVTGRSAWDYNGYGCYCGWGGSGTPIDGIDRCCLAHDECYQRLIDANENPKTEWYSWTRGTTGTVICNDATNTPDYQTCACDRDAAYCFGRYGYDGKRNCQGELSGLNPSGVYWAR